MKDKIVEAGNIPVKWESPLVKPLTLISEPNQQHGILDVFVGDLPRPNSADAVGLDVSSANIQDPKGIQCFTELTGLNSNDLQLTG